MLLASSSTDGGSFVDIDVPAWAWVALLAFIATLLLIDLLVIHRKAHAISPREAMIESAVWIGIGLGFTGVMLACFGGQAAGEYLSGYLIEKSLSIDNVFVWALILSYFLVPAAYQHRVLFWGIFGALFLRATFIFAGIALIQRFELVLVLFGLFLLYTAWKLMTSHQQAVDPARSRVLKLVRRLVPSTDHYDEAKLFTIEDGRRLATPLFAVLLLVEATDVVFAVDSVPAVLAVSHEQFIVFSSNAFAILGLRALYFLLAGMQARFRYLQQGLAVILAFVGFKMVLARWVHIHTWVSLAVIAAVLAVSVVLSNQAERRAPSAGDPPPDDRRDR